MKITYDADDRLIAIEVLDASGRVNGVDPTPVSDTYPDRVYLSYIVTAHGSDCIVPHVDLRYR